MKKMSLMLSGLLCMLFLLPAACKKEHTDPPVQTLHPYTLNYPNYVPMPNLSADNPLTEEGVALGRRLYYDPILSNDGRSCSSCHDPQKGFTDSIHNALPHVNLAWNTHFLWNGGVEGNLDKAMHFEVNEFFHTDISKLQQHADYPALFRQVFGAESITETQVAFALSQFIASLVSMDTRFDRYLKKQLMLSDAELRGFYIFNTERGDCFHCHSLGLMTDGQFHNNGLSGTFSGVDQGRYNVTGLPADRGKFKTPSLKNIAQGAPYMHDGRYKTLEEVIEFYNAGIQLSPTLDPIMTKASFENGLQLSALEKADLLAFLRALSDSIFLNNPAHSAP